VACTPGGGSPGFALAFGACAGPNAGISIAAQSATHIVTKFLCFTGFPSLMMVV